VRAILDTSVLLAGAEARPDLTGIEGRVSSVSYGELNFGVSVAKTAEGGASRLARMQRIIAVYGSGVPFDDLVAASYGYLFGVSLRAGRRSRTRVADLMIAATAHHLGVPLITRNTADFAAVSSHVEIVAR
jgi:predicted nucleic acid-binding protein